MEVVTAFFVEAGFIGVLLYGDGRVRKGTMFLSTVMVSIGTVLSSTWIIAANSWMQTPAGYKVVHGQFEPTDWMRVIFNPSFLWRWPHMLAAVLISASFFVAGISAWYLVKGRAKGFARRSMSIALGIAALLMPVQLYLGDNVAGHELPYQLSKLEAIEGNWDNGDTGFVLFSIPDQQAARNIAQLADAAAVAHRVDDAAGRAVYGDGLSRGCFEPFDAEGEGLRGVLRHHGRRVGDRGAVCTARHGDVHCCGDVVDQLVQGKSGLTAHDGARSPRAHGQQICVRGLRCVCPPVDPSGQFAYIRRDQGRQISEQ